MTTLATIAKYLKNKYQRRTQINRKSSQIHITDASTKVDITITLGGTILKTYASTPNEEILHQFSHYP
jgi:hypothetical protein